MAPPLSTTGEASVNAPSTGDVWAVFVTLAHADLSPSVLFCDLDADQARLGDTYTAREFTVTLPDESQDSLPQLSLTVQDVDRSLDSALTDISVTTEDRPTVSFSVVNMADLGVDQAGPWTLEVVKHDHSVGGPDSSPVTVVGLQFPNLVRESFPGDLVRPANMPGSF